MSAGVNYRYLFARLVVLITCRPFIALFYFQRTLINEANIEKNKANFGPKLGSFWVRLGSFLELSRAIKLP
jgi:hypothetical protein